jgi:Protein of unknown function (DUF3800)
VGGDVVARELIIYCDESIDRGRHYSNFYGGALVESRHLLEVESRLQNKKVLLNFHGEVKWQKITENYAAKYIAFVDEVFALVGEGKLKIRIMFTHNYLAPKQLTPEQSANQFLLLYYQFLKHTFGLQYAGISGHKTNIRLMLDRLPATRDQVAAFKGFLLGLNRKTDWQRAHIGLRDDQIAEVDSNDHVVMQALDIVLGAIQFRLNDKHKEKPEGASRRGKRTIAKEKVYDQIRRHIRRVTKSPYFNIGISTAQSTISARWEDYYRHWKFVSKQAEIQAQFSKKKAKHK